MSKIIQSRDDWRSKAISRATAIREHRKTEKRYRVKIATLQETCAELKQPIEDAKKTVSCPIHSSC
ncbi:conserved hypothetical protein [Crenothrix polyspora]|uniref:Uncharacterized protein n=1 Tax=Crenothrix polyspora TaxID=360316 RepID=A0A1R4HGV6_9GAMM|nr:conserved hypothetical protein [Crenothrix polyspora]